MKNLRFVNHPIVRLTALLALLLGQHNVYSASSDPISQLPIYLTDSQKPLLLITMSRDHKMFNEAYNDYSDLNGDGSIDIGYKPAITYAGYFDSYKCYDYTTSGTDRFTPVSINTDKKCSAKWSGDFLNYVTTSRMDALRKVLYGGYRHTDNLTMTILERAFIPHDAHTWAKEYMGAANNPATIALNGYDIREYTPLSMPSAAGNTILFANVTHTSATSAPLMRVLEGTTNRPWNWVSIEASSEGQGGATCSSGPCGTIADYKVRVEVCNSTIGLETDCFDYHYDVGGTDTISYKPTGLLHNYSGTMYFGLLTGSYGNNLNGGVMRRTIFPFSNEFEAKTGVFYRGSSPPSNTTYKDTTPLCDWSYRKGDNTLASGTSCTQGMVDTIDKIRIATYNYSGDGSYAHGTNYNCGWFYDTPTDGKCPDWGNPIGEMLYEGLRYFAGKKTPTASFVSRINIESDLSLALPNFITANSWGDPYGSANGDPYFPACSKPYQMLISDVYPSFDSDSVPGSAFASFTTDLPTSANAVTLGQTMWNNEFGSNATKNINIGETLTWNATTLVYDSTADNAPTVKAAKSFALIRGLAPGDPSRQGSYSVAEMAYYGHINDINTTAAGSQKVTTYSVALSSPLPDILVPVTGGNVKIVPFAKTVTNPASDTPNNQIVDFYYRMIRNVTGAPTDNTVNGGRAYYHFQINYEDVDQGADHDLDAIAEYEVQVLANNDVQVKVNSTYAKGGNAQHMGYVISGTTADGPYLVVRDCDTANGGVAAPCVIGGSAPGTDPDYALDTPNTTGVALPLTDTRSFTPSNSTPDSIKDPLWYAAKWGGFNDANGNSLPDNTEWNVTSGGTVPSNYFLVTNPTTLKAELKKAFDKIRDDSGTSAALSTNSFSFQTDTLLFQSRFNSDGWTGELNAYPVTSSSIAAPTWQAQAVLADKSATNRVILTYDPDNAWASRGVAFRWANINTNTTLKAALHKDANNTTDSKGNERVSFLRGDEDPDFRARPLISGTSKYNKLGDIVNSQAQYVGRPNFGYSSAGYALFTVAKQNRTPMVYVGANDGMLHGFKATTTSNTNTDSGDEKLAYIPSEMYRARDTGKGPRLSLLTDKAYGKSTLPHRYYVDGSPVTGDICTNTTCTLAADWKSILVGGLSGGGQAVYALDVTDPANFAETNAASIVKWEFKDTDHDGSALTGTISGDSNLGYTYGRPFIVQLCTDRDNVQADNAPSACLQKEWFVMFANGYKSDEADGSAGTGKAVLYVVNANTGYLATSAPITVGTAGNGPNNGLSELAPVDLDGDGTIDLVYAGDLKGNLWRFNFYDDSPSNWAVSFGGTPLYTAKDWQASPALQPITTAPDVMAHPSGGVLVVFGTGSYLFDNDKDDMRVQALYGIWDTLWANNGNWDTNTSVSSTNHNNLQGQYLSSNTQSDDTTNTIGGGTAVTTSHEYRAVTRNTVDWTTLKGWYLRLTTQDTGSTLVNTDLGERIVFNPEIRGGSLLKVTSTVPVSDICASGGYGWDFYIDALTGMGLSFNPFPDYDLTTTFTMSTGSTQTPSMPSARKSSVGIVAPGTVITEGQGRGTVFQGGSTGEFDLYKTNLGQATAGRLSWRELLTD